MVWLEPPIVNDKTAWVDMALTGSDKMVWVDMVLTGSDKMAWVETRQTGRRLTRRGVSFHHQAEGNKLIIFT